MYSDATPAILDDLRFSLPVSELQFQSRKIGLCNNMLHGNMILVQ